MTVGTRKAEGRDAEAEGAMRSTPSDSTLAFAQAMNVVTINSATLDRTTRASRVPPINRDGPIQNLRPVRGPFKSPILSGDHDRA
jgi:hypothetical protein